MGFIRVSELPTKSGFSAGRTKNYALMVSVRKSSKDGRRSLSFTIGHETMKRARLQIGDRMDFEMDDSSSLWRMFRVTGSKGWALSNSGGGKTNPSVSILWREGLPNVKLGREYLNDVTVDDDGIYFDFPSSLIDSNN